MKMTCFFFFLFSFHISFANIQFDPAQQILMKGSSCQELENYAQSILDWALIINSTLAIPQPECFCSTKSCQTDVAPLSPYFVVELTNFQRGQMDSAHNGPNCFNAALYSAKTVPSVSFTHPYEMTAILESSLCKERKRTEELQPGDILVVRDQSNPLREIHAGVYVHEQLSFSKYGESKMMPYSYGVNVEKSYGVHEAACTRIEGTPQLGSVCYQKPYVNFYSCEAMYSFVSKIANQPGGIDEAVRGIYAGISSLDNTISKIAFKGNPVSGDEFRAMQSRLADLYQQSIRLGQRVDLNKGNREFLRLMHFHIFSLYEQTRRIALSLGEKTLASEALSKPSL